MSKAACVGNGEQTDEEGWEKLPRTWPDRLDEAVNALNHRILPALRFSPKELLLGIAINMPKTGIDTAEAEVGTPEATIHMVYAAQQRIDGYEAMVKHAITRKRAFDRRVLKSSGEVIFNKGQLVQVYRSDLDYTFKTERKILPKWSQPHRITKRIRNAYELERLEGTPIEGEFSARRLRAFIPRPGSTLEQEQKEWEEKHSTEEETELETQGTEVDAVRTPLFAGGEHGVGIGDKGAREPEPGQEGGTIRTYMDEISKYTLA
jgi:hypothetical protein